MTPEIEEFARVLIQNVRDRAIRQCDILLNSEGKSKLARKWKQLRTSGLDFAVADVVDETVFSILLAIDQGLLRLKYASPSGKEVDLHEEGEGELGGWYAANDGWRAMFSAERFDEY